MMFKVTLQATFAELARHKGIEQSHQGISNGDLGSTYQSVLEIQS